jgi:hypothetical protein
MYIYEAHPPYSLTTSLSFPLHLPQVALPPCTYFTDLTYDSQVSHGHKNIKYPLIVSMGFVNVQSALT